MTNRCQKCDALVEDRTGRCPQCSYARSSSPPGRQPLVSEGGEYAEVTAVFSDLVGYTALNEEEEPEIVAELMDRIKRKASEIFEAHGGMVNQFVGDEILGLFGVSESHDDDPVRAVSAALEVHAFVREQTVLRRNGTRRLLEMHSGVETGRTFVRAADIRAGACSVVGNDINLAARLRSLANRGEILVGPTAHRRLGTHFYSEARGPVQVRGKSLPVEAFRIRGWARRSGAFEKRHATLAPFVGRDSACQQLKAAWSDTCAGHGRLVLISGPPGIGKSRILHEFRHWLRSDEKIDAGCLLYAKCFAYGQAAPYQPFIDALLEYVGAQFEGAGLRERMLKLLGRNRRLSSATTDTLLRLIAPAAHPEAGTLDGTLMREAIAAALTEFLTASERPVLLALEDWHSADEPSRTALRQLVKHMQGTPLLVLVNRRSETSDDGLLALANEHIELGSLEEDATQRLASSVLGAAKLSSQLRGLIQERSLGNPFFVEEICRVLQSDRALSTQDGVLSLSQPTVDLRIPDSVQAVVRARVSCLPHNQRKVLGMAAVVGMEFSVDEMEALWGHPYRDPNASQPLTEGASALSSEGVLDAMRELEAQGILHAANVGSQWAGYRFNHAITQSVVYASMSSSARRWYHGCIGAYLEAQFGPEALEARYEILSHHFVRSNDRSKAASYALKAAEKAWRSFSLEQAVAQYRDAVAALDDLRTTDHDIARARIQATVDWARVALYNPNLQVIEALGASLHLAEALGDASSACSCLNWLSWIQYGLGNYAEACELSERFLAAARTLGSRTLIAQAVTNLGLSKAMATQYAAAEAALQEGIALRVRAGSTGHVYAKGYLALIRADQGNFEEADLHLAEATAIVGSQAKLTTLGPLLVQRGLIEIWKGDWSACLDTARAARSIADRIGGSYIRAMSRAIHGYALFRLGDEREQALERLRSACELLEGAGVRLHLSWCYGLLADALVLNGKYQEAQIAAERALARAEQQDTLGEVTALRAMATIALRQHRDLAAAATWAQRALEAATAKGSQREIALAHRCQADLI